MKVQQVIIENGHKRYMLIDDNGMPIIPVIKYLKHLENTKKSINTLKTYCYNLKNYFTYLHVINKDYSQVTINTLSDFVTWLLNPCQNLNTIPIKQVKSKRKESTVNQAITVVANFYDFLYRTEQMDSDLISKLMKKMFSPKSRKYKDFLYHVNKDKPVMKNILLVKEPKRRIRILTKEEVKTVYYACSNIRDKFLVRILFETGIRIGEALSLFIEDFVFDHQKGHRIRLVDRGELVNGACLKTGDREIHISQELMDLFDEYMYQVLDELEIDTNFVFVKIRGNSIGQPLDLNDAEAIFRRLKRKTGLNIHAHLLRHTHATILYRITKNIKYVQERLGHAQVQTTMDLYLHPSDDDIRKEWEKAEGVFLFD